MPSPNDGIRIRHMFDYSREAVLLAEKRGRSDLDADRMLQIAGMRNRLIHGYDFVDYDILWQTVAEDLPALIRELENVAAGLPGKGESP